MDAAMRDLAYAARSLRKSPAFALTAVVTLALGVGVITAVFSVANAVLLRPLSYVEPERLVLVWGELRNRNLTDFPFPPGDFQDLRTGATLFEDLAAVTPARQPLAGDGSEPEQVDVVGVTTNLLPLLGARIALGRGFEPDDALPPPAPPQAGPAAPAAGNAPPPPQLPAIVVLNHGFWQRRYGGDPGIVGRTIDLGGARAQVVGVLGPGFELLLPPAAGVPPVPDMLAAMRIDYETASRTNVFLRVIGRLKPGVGLAAAQEQADRVAADLRERFPIKETAGLRLGVVPMHEDLVSDARPAIVALMGAGAFVLLIACSNVANLLLVRASARDRELAVRAALGSSPWRLVRQTLAESLLLAACGALVGLALAFAGIRLLTALAPASLPRLGDVAIDPTVLGFAVLLSVAAAALFGIAPALRAARPDLAEALRSGRAAGLAGGRALRNAVVTTEVALSFVLLVGCGLMVRSFVTLQRADPGYDPSGVLTFAVAPLAATPDERAAFVRRLGERLRALPGVRAATAATPLPLDGGVVNARWGTEDAVADPSKFQQANVHIVLPGYFEAMRTRLVAGRTFTPEDDRADATRLVIDERLAAKAFPGTPAVGRRLLVRVRSAEPEWFEVIGVVAHQRHETLAADGREAIFVTDGLMGSGVAGRWAVRTSGPPSALVPAVRRAVAELDARLPVSEVQPMQALVDRARGPTKFALVLIGVFAVIAALLAAVGLYGVLSTGVRQRTAEIGVRMALGAPSASVFRLVVGEGMRLSALGVAIGLAAALLLTRVIRSMLVGVEATDPATFAAIALLFFAIAGAACWLPARHAAGLDPKIALREE